MNEEQAIATHIASTLKADAAVGALVGDRIYEEEAPSDASKPFVIFFLQTGDDRGQVGREQRLFSRPLYCVKAISEGASFAAADAIMDAVDAALTGSRSEAGGYSVFAFYRERAIRKPETARGRRINHVGGLYRVLCEGPG